MKKTDLSKISYDKYKEIQLKRSSLKWNSRAFLRYRYKYFIKMISDTVDKIGVPKSICCMGIRKGNEYTAFKEIDCFQDSIIYGIDINPAVVDVGDNCYCYDFNKLPDEWQNKFDLVYSNSIDHSYDIEKTLDEWSRVSKKYLFITFAKHETNECDIYSFTSLDEVKEVIKDKFKIVKTWYFDGVSVLLEKI